MQGGQPCGKCQSGGGMGEQMGIGQGGIAPTEKTATGFKTERVKVPTTKGAIVGQFLVDGDQVRGEASKELAEILVAAERDASDLVYRERIPRQYHKAVRNYFKTMQSAVKIKKNDKEVKAKPEPSAPPEKRDSGE